MKNIIIVSLMLLSNNCSGQKINNNSNNGKMKYYNEKEYKDWEIDSFYESSEDDKHLINGNDRVRIIIYTNEKKEKIIVEKSNKITPYEYNYVYSYKNKTLLIETKKFYSIKIGIQRYYDETGKLIKETDYDKPYKFSIEDLINKMKNEYNIDLLDTKHIISLYRYEEKKDLNIPLYEIWYNYDNSNRNNVECYLINGTTGETLFTVKRFLGDKKGSLLQNYLEGLKDKNTSAIYKTYQGKSYTQSEWQAYEEKEYEAYCKRTGRPYTPKSQEPTAENQSYKSPFLAEDWEKGDDSTPKKKKGFWG
ncbi:hypothetical protein [Chryseobacterium sp. FH2]|uniref:hypothetical protein n=1 Tax=Chryseobacterium sp. FH2 TaxID=1674291 RepID=UPI00065AF35B|nr:hypothetical protein [Chryseobacterium sp. FH2]